MTSATFLKARSTAAAKVYEITSTSPDDTEVTLPNDFGSKDVLVQIEPAGRGMPADYLASDWRISDESTAEKIVLRKTPAPGSGHSQPQAVAVVTRLAGAAAVPFKALTDPSQKAKTKAPKARK